MRNLKFVGEIMNVNIVLVIHLRFVMIRKQNA